MPKPKLVDRPVEKRVNLPTSIVAQVDLMLYSEVESRIPHAAWSRYVRELIEADLTRRRALLAAHHKGIHRDNSLD